MEYKVKLHSNDKIINDITFDDKPKALSHIEKVVTDSKTPIELELERLYLTKDGIETLTTIVYHLYKAE